MLKAIFVSVWSISVLLGTVVALEVFTSSGDKEPERAATNPDVHQTPILSIAIFDSLGQLTGYLTTKVEVTFDVKSADDPLHSSLDVIVEDALLHVTRKTNFSIEKGAEQARDRLAQVRAGMIELLAEKEPKINVRALRFVEPSLVTN